MKKLIVILLCALSLSAYASYFEVQVPMSDRQTQMFAQKPLTTGHFQTTVQALDGNGHAYSPGQSSSPGKHIRKVGHDDDEDDPFMPAQVDPIGDTPWILFLLLAVGYGAFELRKRSA